MPTQKINAVLVRLSINTFNNSRQDPAITDDVRLRKGLGVGAGKWVKYKLPDEALEPIRKFAGEVRRRHYDMTLPWEEGYRMLSAKAQASYQDVFHNFERDFNKHLSEFMAQYPNWLDQAKLMHGKTYNTSDYPSAAEMPKHFRFGIEYTPMPRSEHFVVQGLAEDAIEEMRNDLEQRNTQRVQAAIADTWQRLLAPVQAMAEKLSGKDTIFRDTLVTNVRDILALIPALNLDGNPQLVEATRLIEQQLANVNPDTLRENVKFRKEIADAAKALASRFAGIGQRKFAA
ncbi:MAG TPA: hypothetical protein VFB72_11075 [Verrucomicrobiae bacterium]|nr:hypothetical protein [Verrucomicrobiae bacterium]